MHQVSMAAVGGQRLLHFLIAALLHRSGLVSFGMRPSTTSLDTFFVRITNHVKADTNERSVNALENYFTYFILSFTLHLNLTFFSFVYY